MNFPFFFVNTFCKGTNSGNPSGVCILEKWPSTDELQNMASQVCLPETAFLFRSEKEVWSIRCFSPKEEMEFCGHSSLAVIHVLFQQGLATANRRIKFVSKRGVLWMQALGENRYCIDFHTLKNRPTRITPNLIEVLGAYPDEVLMGLNLVCIFKDEEIISELQPDFRIFSGFSSCQGVIVTSETSKTGFDFISRCFASGMRFQEDHGTVSAHRQLAHYWSKKLGKEKLVGYQSSLRGAEIRCQISSDHVIIEGKAETFISGSTNL